MSQDNQCDTKMTSNDIESIFNKLRHVCTTIPHSEATLISHKAGGYENIAESHTLENDEAANDSSQSPRKYADLLTHNSITSLSFRNAAVLEDQKKKLEEIYDTSFKMRCDLRDAKFQVSQKTHEQVETDDLLGKLAEEIRDGTKAEADLSKTLEQKKLELKSLYDEVKSISDHKAEIKEALHDVRQKQSIFRKELDEASASSPEAAFSSLSTKNKELQKKCVDQANEIVGLRCIFRSQKDYIRDILTKKGHLEGPPEYRVSNETAQILSRHLDTYSKFVSAIEDINRTVNTRKNLIVNAVKERIEELENLSNSKNFDIPLDSDFEKMDANKPNTVKTEDRVKVMCHAKCDDKSSAHKNTMNLDSLIQQSKDHSASVREILKNSGNVEKVQKMVKKSEANLRENQTIASGLQREIDRITGTIHESKQEHAQLTKVEEEMKRKCQVSDAAIRDLERQEATLKREISLIPVVKPPPATNANQHDEPVDVHSRDQSSVRPDLCPHNDHLIQTNHQSGTPSTLSSPNPDDVRSPSNNPEIIPKRKFQDSSIASHRIPAKRKPRRVLTVPMSLDSTQSTDSPKSN